MQHTHNLYNEWQKQTVLIKRKTIMQRFGYANALICGALASLLILNIYSLLTVF